MKLSPLMAGALISVGLVFSPAMADESADPLKGYQKTGETKNCVNLSGIRTTRVLDDQHILFKMIGKKLYINTLSHECSQLGFYKSFAYKTYGSTLCSVDTITVLTGGAVPGPTCGLGKFEEVEKVDASASAEGSD